MSCKIRWTWERLSMSVVMGSRVDKHFLSIHVGRGSSRHEELGEAPMTLPTSSSDTDLNSSMGVPVKGARVAWRWSGYSTGFSARPTWMVLILSVRKELNWSEVYVFLWPQTSKNSMFFSIYDGSQGPKSNSWLCCYTRHGNTRILCPFWRKLVENQKCLSIFMAKNMKNMVFIFDTPLNHQKKCGIKVVCTLSIYAFAPLLK